MQSRPAPLSHSSVSPSSHVEFERLAKPIAPDMACEADVQFVHCDAVLAPVQIWPSASVAGGGITAARSALFGSVRSFQLLATRTSSAGRCTGAVVGIPYLPAISGMLSVALTCRMASMWLASQTSEGKTTALS